ncbi:D-aminoacyl-tRNA deacylase [Desulfohalovibrio reitneri]|uniref:D-aminoacyl-tRNA deacylase n=1 Tax=Desulfohalovibrio reitneri TaxID=1307759 RepID=UPI0004A71C98|nr:D-aminoacyl-tRNA deacylase [Desulfohalovibrio reitneri]
MRLLAQRVSRARVESGGGTLGEIGPGLCVLVGFGRGDGEDLPGSPIWEKMLAKLMGLRIFEDEAGKLNLSLEDTGGGLLLVSQFTLYADCRKGRRPSFHVACPPETAEGLYDRLVADCSARLPGRVQSGRFAASMNVELVNHGPVTILLDSEKLA